MGDIFGPSCKTDYCSVKEEISNYTLALYLFVFVNLPASVAVVADKNLAIKAKGDILHIDADCFLSSSPCGAYNGCSRILSDN